MKKIINKISLVLVILLVFSGCENFEDMNTNPDLSIKVTPDMLATTLILDITRGELSSTKGFMRPFMLDKYLIWSEFIDQDELLNRLGRNSFYSYTVLTNADKMVSVATDYGSPELLNSYKALRYFIRAWKLFHLTMEVGDIPYSEAFQAEETGNINPPYDTQEKVIKGILTELEEADKLFSIGANFSGDPVYGGDATKWRKAVNAFHLNVLIQLSKRVDDSTLDVPGRFKRLFESNPLISDNSENFQLAYSNATGETYPFAKPNPFSIYPIISTTLMDTLIQLKDYRLFYYASPSPVRISNGVSQSSFDAYNGIDPVLSYSEAGVLVGTNDYSLINERYFLSTGEPIAMLSFAQLNFNLAEAAARGWISAEAETYYNKGIRAAFNFVAKNTLDDAKYHHNMKITDDYIDQYIASAPVKFRSADDRIKQILIQKYISTFLQIPRSAFYDHRRTGFPVLPFDPATNLNDPSDKFPVRWMYPQVELDYNTDNVKEAINRQFGGNDDNNGIMWLLK